MGAITLQQAALWCGGQIDPKYKDVAFFGANNDTRKITPGQLFVALQGARDGHDFIPAALEKGAAAVLCTHCDGDYPAIVVPDTRLALGQIAKAERQRIGMKVVGITGSVGKSTTKEMVAAILSTTYRVSKTPANHNNDIGMPMAILAMPEDTQVAVLEMGMNHFREIAYLSQIGQPDISAIVNIGTMHIEHLGSREGILQAKLEILEGMKPEGTLVVDGDESLLWNLQKRPGNRLVYFGMNNTSCQVYGDDLEQGEGYLKLNVRTEQQSFRVELPVEGKHNAVDALAAIAVCMELGVPVEKICQSLANFENMEGRQQIRVIDGVTYICDYYNAGPESMAAALEVLGSKTGRRIAVLGDMLELGVCTQAEHYRIGRIAAQKADVVYAYGPNSIRVLNGCITGGMPEDKARAFTDRDRLIDALKRIVGPEDVLLIKGSRGMKMELVYQQLIGGKENA